MMMMMMMMMTTTMTTTAAAGASPAAARGWWGPPARRSVARNAVAPPKKMDLRVRQLGDSDLMVGDSRQRLDSSQYCYMVYVLKWFMGVYFASISMQVPEICLGTMTWGQQNTEKEAHEQLSYALDCGVNFMDTAEMYPVPTSAETQVEAVAHLGGGRGGGLCVCLSFEKKRKRKRKALHHREEA